MAQDGRTALRRGRHEPPRLADAIVLRDDLRARLCDPNVRVAVITAPGGYGKTSHIAACVTDDPRPCAWVDLHEWHNDATALLSDLLDAFDEVTDIDRTGLHAVGGTQLQMSTEVPVALGAAVGRSTRPFLLVLDDAHLVTDHPAVDLLTALLAAVPPGSTVAIIGRACALEVLHRLRVETNVLEVSAEDMALSERDVATLVAQLGIEDASDEEIRRLTEETEGWPVGVRLAVLDAMASRGDSAAPLTLSGRQPHVAGYLDTEWLRGLDDDERIFITQASVLDRLTGPSCNAILDRVDSGAMLHRLHNSRLLAIPLDRRGEAYRMHGLLREALFDELQRHDESAARVLHLRASRWLEETGDADGAIRHAIAGNDLDRAEELVIRHTAEAHTHGRYATVARWIDSIPYDRVTRSPGLCYAAATARLGLGDGPAVRVWLTLAEQALVDCAVDAGTVRWLVVCLRSTTNTGPVKPALDAAQQARHALPLGIWHAGAQMICGAWAWTMGDRGAQHLLEDGAHESAVLGAPTMEANCEAILSLIAGDDGDDIRANALAIHAHEVLAASGLDRAPALVVVTAAYAWAMARTGDPAAARANLNLARSQLANWREGFGWANVQSRIALARTSLLLGDRTGAETMVREAHEFLIAQPDAVGAQRQLADLEERVRHLRSFTGMGPSSLTTAELRVLHFLPTNLSLAEIANRLYVSRYTIKTHCESIYRKLGAAGRSETVDTARRVGLLGADSLDEA